MDPGRATFDMGRTTGAPRARVPRVGLFGRAIGRRNRCSGGKAFVRIGHSLGERPLVNLPEGRRASAKRTGSAPSFVLI